MWAVVVVVTLMLHGQAHVTRHVSQQRWGEEAHCDHSAERLARRLAATVKSRSTVLAIGCEQLEDFPA